MIPAEEKEDYRILTTKQTNLACLTQIGIHWNDGRHAARFRPAVAPLPRHMPDICDSPAPKWTIPAIILGWVRGVGVRALCLGSSRTCELPDSSLVVEHKLQKRFLPTFILPGSKKVCGEQSLSVT